MKRKLAGLSLVTKTLNEIIVGIRTLPAGLALYGATFGAILGGVVYETPLWAAAGSVGYLLVTAWLTAAQPYKLRQRLLADLGLERAATLNEIRVRAAGGDPVVEPPSLPI